MNFLLRLFRRQGLLGGPLLLCLSLLATMQAQSLPRLALQYWQPGDYPNYPGGHIGLVWVDGHDEDNDDGSGHWEDRDGDGIDDTWVPDTHWVDGHYDNQWIDDGPLPDGLYGSTWATSAGLYNITSPSSAFQPAVPHRGFLANAYPQGSPAYFRAYGYAPDGNCNSYSVRVFSPAGALVAGPFAFASSLTVGLTTFSYLNQPGLWRIEIQYQGATGVTPTSGAVNYYVGIGLVAQSIVFDPIPNHAKGDAPFAPVATASSGLPVTFSIVSGPATLSNGAITVTGDGTVVVRAQQPGGLYGGTAISPAASVDRSFSVSGNAQTIGFPAIPDHVHGDAPFALTATASSGLPVSFAINSGPATLAGNLVTLTGAGTVTVTAAQPGGGAYGIAPTVSRSFTVATDNTPPTVPTGLTATNFKTGGFGLTWAASSDGVGVTAYEVRRDGTTVATVTTLATTFTGLTSATAYALAVRARDAAGNWSAWSTPLTATTLAFTPPRLALEYWQGGDYPGKPYGHDETVWIDGHDEPNDDGSGHWEDQDGDGIDDTWVPDTHWVDGYYCTYWVQDGTYPNGQYGSSWATSTGNYDIAESASNATNASRGYLLCSQSWGMQDMKFHLSAPSANCSSFACYVRDPAGNYPVFWGNGGAAGNTAHLFEFPCYAAGLWTITITYDGATGLPAPSGSVTYSMWVGQPQALTFATISNHACGDAPFALAATTNSGLPIGYAVVSGPATIANNVVTLTGEGTVVVRAFQIGGVSGGTTWTAAIQDQTFTVHGQPQTITFPALADSAYGSAVPVLAATASSGLPVSYQVDSGPATLSGNTLTITGVGTVTVRATQTGAGTFGPAEPVLRSFVVARGTQTLGFPNIAAHDYGDAPFAISAAASSGLPVSVAVASGPASLAGSTVTLTGLGTVTLTATQAGNANYLPASVSRSFAVNPIPGYRYLTVQGGMASAVGGLTGTTVQIQAGVPTNGKAFTGWSIVAGQGTIAAPASASTTLTLGAGDVTISADVADLYTVSVINGVGVLAGSPAQNTLVAPVGAKITITANPDTGGQYFNGWTCASGSGGVANAASRTTTYTVGPAHSCVQANSLYSHNVTVRVVGPSGGFAWGSASSAGGIRGSVIGLSGSNPSPGSTWQFDGWQIVGGAGMITNQHAESSAALVMGNIDCQVLGWYVAPEYRSIQMATTASQTVIAPKGVFTVTATGVGLNDGAVDNVWLDASSNYGESWSAVPGTGGPVPGQPANWSFTATTSQPDPITMVYRARGTAFLTTRLMTVTSVYSYTRVAVMTPGVLTVRNGTGSAAGLSPNATVAIAANVPAGMVFTRWRKISGEGDFGDANSPNTTYTLGVTAAEVQAEYLADYPLTVQNGTAAKPGGPMGTQIQITAAAGSGAFVGWTFSGSSGLAGSFANAASPSTTFTMGNYPATIRANYTNSLQTLSLFGGTAGTLTGPTGATTTITANPLAGYYFRSWRFIGAQNGTLANADNRSTLFTFGLGDTGLEPNYEVGGTLTVLDGTAARDGGAPGAVIAISAVVPTDNEFDGWVVPPGGGNGSFGDAAAVDTTFTMGTGNAVIRAKYKTSLVPPVVSGGSAVARVGSPFTYQIVATKMTSVERQYGTAQPLPQGLVLNAFSGQIIGTPLVAGPVTITLTATNKFGTSSAPLILTVEKGTQTIAFDLLPNKAVADAPFALGATTSSGLTVAFELVSGPAALTGNLVTLTGAGSVTVRAVQAGDANYAAAANVERSFLVTAGSGNGAPFVTQSPTSQIVALGQTATFTVGAAGNPALSYQWQKNANPILGATLPQFAVVGAQAIDFGSYTVVITNAQGTTTSLPALLIVKTGNPKGDDDHDGVSNEIEDLLGYNKYDPNDASAQRFEYDKTNQLKAGPGGRYLKDAEGNITEVRP